MRPSIHEELAVSSDGKSDQTCESSDNQDDTHKVTRRKQGADKEMMYAFLSSIELYRSRRRPRKEIPATEMDIQTSKKQRLKMAAREDVDFKMVDLGDEDGPEIIGRRVEVYWPDSRRWFRGRVKAFDHQKMVHKIDYDDGDRERLDLKNEVFRIEVYPGESFKVKPEPIIKHKLKSPIVKDKEDRQKGYEAENGIDGQEKESGNTLSCRHSLSQVERASNGSDSLTCTDEPPLETHHGIESVEDEYLSISHREVEAEDPKQLEQQYDHKMGKKHCSEKMKFHLDSQKVDMIPLNVLSCTYYYARRKKTLELSHKCKPRAACRPS